MFTDSDNSDINIDENLWLDILHDKSITTEKVLHPKFSGKL
jgi:hypothetical protein